MPLMGPFSPGRLLLPAPLPWAHRVRRGLELLPLARSPSPRPRRGPWPRLLVLGELVPAEAAGRLLSSAAGSLIVALVSAPRKLQADELATVRALFQENTPFAVCITIH
ncbi:uncharacterized protein C2845_PM08G04320 [Panicum miliaceum]|uniref:Uncharacterized protein n=1 Tax=Panicum miliaceum TaxID=4540 RepID=A0A3L6QZU8_PANMI|nr:uncharacterized protein C2845_PM08G04320 [Panicum miliaceum]